MNLKAEKQPLFRAGLNKTIKTGGFNECFTGKSRP